MPMQPEAPQPRIRLWLDDERPAPEGWHWAKSVDEAKALVENGVEEASLDNDLGDSQAEGRSLVLWMAETDTWPDAALQVHSANPVAVEAMIGIIDRYGPYQRRPRPTRFER